MTMFHRIGALACSLVLLATPGIAEGDLPPLLTPAGLIEVMDETDALILDIRDPGAAGVPGSYGAGHVAGAVNAPYALFRGPAENPGQLPAEAELTRVLQSLGVTADRPIVIIHQGRDETDFGAAARVYWTLKSSGVSNLAILNGGVEGWVAAGHALETAFPSPAPSTFEVRFSDRWLATEADVLAVAEGRATARLIDARPEDFWAGRDFHGAAARPGTLPQSEFFTHSNWFRSGPTIVDPASARALAEAAGYTDGAALISFCNTGHWAATNWFALSELAGIENVSLYPESMVGWSNAGHAMANVPGPFRRVWMQIVDAF
jgi:thiosulfate/3-mercaptopyruvate sulfurtransferase